MNPAQLWVSPHEIAARNVEHYLQTIFCNAQPCLTCSTCTQIRQQSYYACHWFNPENNYTLSTLQPFFSAISQSLDDEKKFFFIFFHADYLTHACVNSLLKSIEEPPHGYNFIFVAKQLHSVAATLRSRCIIKYSHTSTHITSNHDLLQFFITPNADPELFMKTLDTTALDDRSTHALLNEVLEHWVTDYTKSGSVESKQTIEFLKEAFEKLPMPGSAKLFWKNLFLQIQ